jgi:hypothetical protein
LSSITKVDTWHLNSFNWPIFRVHECIHFIYIALANDCSELNISNNLQQCLTSIWTKANDKNAFWFGKQWASICGYNPLDSPYCTSLQQPYTPHSLLNTIYGLDWDLSQNPLTQFLNVTYHTKTGKSTF